MPESLPRGYYERGQRLLGQADRARVSGGAPDSDEDAGTQAAVGLAAMMAQTKQAAMRPSTMTGAKKKYRGELTASLLCLKCLYIY